VTHFIILNDSKIIVPNPNLKKSTAHIIEGSPWQHVFEILCAKLDDQINILSLRPYTEA
jgi:hypothetical protein